jgi:hypothetical protein
MLHHKIRKIQITPFPAFPQGERSLLLNGTEPTVSPLGEIRKGVVYDQKKLDIKMCIKNCEQ